MKNEEYRRKIFCLLTIFLFSLCLFKVLVVDLYHRPVGLYAVFFEAFAVVGDARGEVEGALAAAA